MKLSQWKIRSIICSALQIAKLRYKAVMVDFEKIKSDPNSGEKSKESAERLLKSYRDECEELESVEKIIDNAPVFESDDLKLIVQIIAEAYDKAKTKADKLHKKTRDFNDYRYISAREREVELKIIMDKLQKWGIAEK